MKNVKIILTIVAIVISTFISKADVAVADIFSDNMVLQRNLEVKVWGNADANEKITVSFNGQTLKTKAGKNGKWTVVLKPMKAGGPFDMTIKGKNEIILKNILIGDVWVCSGQSNMQWQVANSKDAENEITNANHPNIRLFTVPQKISNVPIDTMPNTTWKVCMPETVKHFSAVSYFFGRNLQAEINVPIGLINSTWGGTCVETWTSKESITKLPKYENFGERIDNYDLKEIKNRKKESLIKAIGNLPDKEKGMTEKWMLPNTDRSNWKTMTLPTIWEKAGYEHLNGIVWFNYDFNLNAEDINGTAYLHLGEIDDSDITWINGQKVGEMKWGQNTERHYKIPQNILKAGKNTITIQVEDLNWFGGFRSSADKLFLQLQQKSIPLSGDWKYKIDIVYLNFRDTPNDVPSLLYNAMIHPLIPYGMKGVIWYQGENNVNRAKEYATTFPNLINNWRSDWQQGEFPFLFVQLANFSTPKTATGDDNWAELREAQTKTLSVKNTAMAVAIDIGEADDIHPKNKQAVGKRLMLSALKVAYDKNIVHSGPIYKSMQIEGSKAIISFNHIGSGLMVKSKHGYINEFEIAGEDKKFYWAKAELKGDKVIVWSDKVEKPVAVRFAWSINPAEFNLYNKEGLPASPFRTDNRKGATDGKSFDD